MKKTENLALILFGLAAIIAIPTAFMGGAYFIPSLAAVTVFGGMFMLIPYLGFQKVYSDYFIQQADNRLNESNADVGAHAIRDDNTNNKDLSNSDLSYLQIPGQDMSHSQMSDARMVNTNLKSAELTGTEMKDVVANKVDMTLVQAPRSKAQSAVFKNAKLLRANFTRAFMPHVKLMGAKARAANFSHANLNRANMKGILASMANFESCKMRSANMKNADFKEANFRSADLKNSDLRGCDIRDADFSFADLRGTALKSVNKGSARFFGAKFNKDTILPFNYEEAFRKGMVLST